MRTLILLLFIISFSCSDNKKPAPSDYKKVSVGEACSTDDKGNLIYQYVEVEGFLEAPAAIWGNSSRVRLYEAPGEGRSLMIDLMVDSSCANCLIVKGKNVYIKEYLKFATVDGQQFPITDKVVVRGEIGPDTQDPGCYISLNSFIRSANQDDIPLYRPELGKMGEPVAIGNLMYTVHSARFTKTVGVEIFSETTKGEFLIVEFEVQNNDDMPHYFSSTDLILKDEKEKKYETSMRGETALSMSGSKTFQLNEIVPGETLTAFLVYEVPGRGDYFVTLNKGTQKGKNFIVKLGESQ